MPRNENLARAKTAKNDEFFTQVADVRSELQHYRGQFRGKTVLCNCDDPYESAFFKYFAMNFNHLGLRKLITTRYTGSPVAGSQLPLPWRCAYKVEITEVPDASNDGSAGLSDVEYLLQNGHNVITALAGDGDFRSPECVALLEEADIVVTNPPFSLFREYIAQLMGHGKQFLVLGSQNAITYQETFRLIKENHLWLGYNNGGEKWFRVPGSYTHTTTESHIKVESGVRYLKMCNINWYTNLDTTKRHEFITLYKQYSPFAYPHYDNYDAIEVSKCAEMPQDFDGAMGVPITFLDKYNPDQFEILGLTSGRDEFDARPTKRYVNARRLNPDGTESNGSNANTRSALLVTERPARGTVYTADGVPGYLTLYYARIIIRNRNPQKAPA